MTSVRFPTWRHISTLKWAFKVDLPVVLESNKINKNTKTSSVQPIIYSSVIGD